ncbi:MAG: hypothetical protein R2712_29365 [Vicinamibacterales bacterium]
MGEAARHGHRAAALLLAAVLALVGLDRVIMIYRWVPLLYAPAACPSPPPRPPTSSS